MLKVLEDGGQETDQFGEGSGVRADKSGGMTSQVGTNDMVILHVQALLGSSGRAVAVQYRKSQPEEKGGRSQSTRRWSRLPRILGISRWQRRRSSSRR